jgi:two-component system sensor histidine kinase HydH
MKRTADPHHRWTAVPPWVVVGAALILVIILGVMARQNIHHQQAGRLRLLTEKGAALIRAFEAGTRTGMMAMRWGRGKLQMLLQETARQPDILYLMVVDRDGLIQFHSDPQQIGGRHGLDTGLAAVVDSTELRTRRLPPEVGASGSAVFEVFRKFQPLERGPGPGRGRHRMGRRHMRGQPDSPPPEPPPAESQFWPSRDKGWAIFVGLDMAPVAAANRADTRQTLLVALAMLLVGGTGLLLLFVSQQFAATRSTLDRIKAFSDTLVTQLPMGLVAVDDRNCISACNPAGAEILGQAPQDLLARPVAEALPAGMWSRIEAAGTRPSRHPEEIEARRADGRPLPLEIVWSQPSDDQGRRQGTVVLFRDVSELQSLRRTVARSQRLAAVGRLAAGVAHEIRNPLSSIKGFATHFRQRDPADPEYRAIADLMIQEVDRLNRVVTQMIEFARPADLARRPVAVNRLVREALTLVASRADAGGHAVAFTPADPEVRLDLDPDQIRQVLLNLFINAFEAMGGEGQLTVTVDPEGQPAGALIRVGDTGPGIDATAQQRVFDPYFSTKPSGTGLGLAIVHNIVEAHGGKVTVDSQPGKGTVVTVFLPPAAGGPAPAENDESERA